MQFVRSFCPNFVRESTHYYLFRLGFFLRWQSPNQSGGSGNRHSLVLPLREPPRLGRPLKSGTQTVVCDHFSLQGILPLSPFFTFHLSAPRWIFRPFSTLTRSLNPPRTFQRRRPGDLCIYAFVLTSASCDTLLNMPLSNRRRARRKEIQLQETSDAEAPDSSPSRPSAKKRKVSFVAKLRLQTNLRTTVTYPKLFYR